MVDSRLCNEFRACHMRATPLYSTHFRMEYVLGFLLPVAAADDTGAAEHVIVWIH